MCQWSVLRIKAEFIKWEDDKSLKEKDFWFVWVPSSGGKKGFEEPTQLGCAKSMSGPCRHSTREVWPNKKSSRKDVKSLAAQVWGFLDPFLSVDTQQNHNAKISPESMEQGLGLNRFKELPLHSLLTQFWEMISTHRNQKAQAFNMPFLRAQFNLTQLHSAWHWGTKTPQKVSSGFNNI